MSKNKNKTTSQGSEPASGSTSSEGFKNPGQISTHSSKPQTFENPGKLVAHLKVTGLSKDAGKNQK